MISLHGKGPPFPFFFSKRVEAEGDIVSSAELDWWRWWRARAAIRFLGRESEGGGYWRDKRFLGSRQGRTASNCGPLIHER